MADLSGRRIVLMRPDGQNEALAMQLRAAGACVEVMPLLRLVVDPDALTRLAAWVQMADWLIFVSPSAVDLAWPTVATYRREQARLAVVGRASAQRVHAYTADDVYYPPHGGDAEALLALPALHDVSGQRVVLIRGRDGRALLPDTLRARGAILCDAAIYRRELLCLDFSRLCEFSPDAIVLTTVQIVEHFFAQLSTQLGQADADCVTTLKSVGFVVPHERVGAALSAYGVSRWRVGAGGLTAMVQALEAVCADPLGR